MLHGPQRLFENKESSRLAFTAYRSIFFLVFSRRADSLALTRVEILRADLIKGLLGIPAYEIAVDLGASC